MTDFASQTFGKRLEAARLAAGLTHTEVGQRLRLDSALILAIEQENYRELPAPAYTRGYIRAYAQLVNCNADALVSEYSQQAGGDPELVEVTSVAAASRSGEPLMLWISAGVIGLLLILLAIWLYDFLQDAGRNTAETAETEIPEYEFPVPAVVTLEENLSGEPGIDVEQSGSLVSTPEDETLATIPTDIVDPVEDIEPEVIPVAPGGSDGLRLDFRGESWLEVYDGSGFRMAYGLFNPASSGMNLQGQAPFQVILGDARVVDITVDGEKIAVQSYMRSNYTAVMLIKSAR
jgi:cytoskeleton protein RodZ